jgi:CelD/BcsL family acetyltransferase involved in cellulose biosynthesis
LSQQIAWNGVHALLSTAPVDARSAQATIGAARAALAADIRVERAGADRLAALADAWDDLAQRADAANVFMHPALLREAIAAYPDRRITALLAWQHSTGAQPRLAGLWAFAVGRAPQSVLPLRVLSAPPASNAYLAAPVIDRDCLDAVCDAFLAYIAADLSLPKIVTLDAMGADTATFAALMRVVAARRGALQVFGRSQRPMLASPLDGKAYLEQAMSSSSRKKLRQHRRRLGEKGVLQSAIAHEADAVRGAFEDFLALEASGWKGREGTALLGSAADAQYARGMIGALAARGEAAIHSLTLDGRPVSMQVVLRSGRTAFTWKTAYDEALQDFSPGTLLLEDYTASLLADPAIDRTDSCAFDDTGYMAAWQERAALAQLWIDARSGGSAAFTLFARLQSGYLALRARAKSIYHQRLRRNGR